jgi:putative MATE family efflux protein
MNSPPDDNRVPSGDDDSGLISRPAPSTIREGSISRTIWRLALPTWGAFVFLNFMGIVDMFFVGKLGPTAVAAVTMGGIMIGIVVMLALGVAMGTTALVANAFGREAPEEADLITAQGLVIAVLMAVLLAAICVPLAPLIIQAMGGSPGVVEEGAMYLRIVAGGGIALLVQIALGAALRGAGDAVTPMKAMVLAILINMVLDPIFIFGLFGFPALGVAGSAYATVLGRGVATLVLVMALLIPGKSPLSLELNQLRPRFDIMGRIFRIGVFASGRAMLRNVSRLALMRLAAMFGTPAVAAFGICFRLQMLILGPGKGFGTAAATMVVRTWGRASRSAVNARDGPLPARPWPLASVSPPCSGAPPQH